LALSFGSRIKSAWNAFLSKETYQKNYGGGSYYRPDRPRLTRGNERSIVTPIYNRISLDVAALKYNHARLDENGRYIENIASRLNECLTLQANIDQTARAFIQDIALSMMDEGVVAVVPYLTTENPYVTSSYDIIAMRTAQIVEWYPRHIRVRMYNDQNGEKEEMTLPKELVAIVENPFYAVMNEPNSTVQRLLRKLTLLDVVDEQTNSNKLNMIIQLPYVIKTDARRQQAEKRRQDIEDQLENSKYGIAYTDGTEKITQLNRSLENNLLSQIEYLTKLMFSQLGVTQEILDGTADEKALLNYNNRIVEPIAAAIVDAMKISFLTRTARSQRQTIMYFSDPFRLVPVTEVAEMADKFTRNEIMTSNEFRQVVGLKPSDDPSADELRNKNLSQPKENNQPSGSEDTEVPAVSPGQEFVDQIRSAGRNRQ